MKKKALKIISSLVIFRAFLFIFFSSPTLNLKTNSCKSTDKKILPQSYFSHCTQYPRGRERRDIMQKRNTVQSLYKMLYYNIDLGKTQLCCGFRGFLTMVEFYKMN